MLEAARTELSKFKPMSTSGSLRRLIAEAEAFGGDPFRALELASPSSRRTIASGRC